VHLVFAESVVLGELGDDDFLNKIPPIHKVAISLIKLPHSIYLRQAHCHIKLDGLGQGDWCRVYEVF
jgi:hypothetical protein